MYMHCQHIQPGVSPSPVGSVRAVAGSLLVWGMFFGVREIVVGHDRIFGEPINKMAVPLVLKTVYVAL